MYIDQGLPQKVFVIGAIPKKLIIRKKAPHMMTKSPHKAKTSPPHGENAPRREKKAPHTVKFFRDFPGGERGGRRLLLSPPLAGAHEIDLKLLNEELSLYVFIFNKTKNNVNTNMSKSSLNNFILTSIVEGTSQFSC